MANPEQKQGNVEYAINYDNVSILTRLEAPTAAQAPTTRPKVIARKAEKKSIGKEEYSKEKEEYIRIAKEAIRTGTIKSWKEKETDKANTVYCTYCVQYPDIVGVLRNNRKRAPITTAAGTQYRSNVIALHLITDYHLACVKRKNSVITAGIAGSSTPMEACISNQNKHKSEKIKQLLFSVYGDAKCLTTAAWNWPARMVAHELGLKYQFNAPEKNEEMKRKMNLQYLNPMSHADLLQCIVEVESKLVAQKMEEAIAISLRADGSVDRTSIDKIYVMAKTIDKYGKLETVFIGIGEQIERGASGLHATIKNVINEHEADLYVRLLKKITSFVTDGASVNVGEHKGLWRLIDDDAKANGATQPIMMVWCAAHRSDLALKDLNKTVEEVPQMINRCSQMASFIRRSGLRMAALRKIASENNLKIMSLPRHFEVRWSQFTSQLIVAVFESWECLVFFFREMIKNDDTHKSDAQGYLIFLTKKENIEMLAFLADFFVLHSKFQKSLQSNTLDFLKLHRQVENFKEDLRDMKTEQILCGYEENVANFMNGRDDLDGDLKYRGITLADSNTRGRKKSCFQDLRIEILDKMQNYMNIRFSEPIDESYESILPFFEFDRTRADVRAVHKMIAPDLDCRMLNLQFKDVCKSASMTKMPLRHLLGNLTQNDDTKYFTELITVLARFVVTTPHSADVERCVSANNCIKTPLRSSIKISTENNLLFVNMNMPPLMKWEPEKTIVHWLTMKERRLHNLTLENENTKARKRPYFNGIFYCGGDRMIVDNSDDDQLNLTDVSLAKKPCP